MIPYVYSNMKKFTLILAALITSTLLTGCNTTPKKHHRGHKKQHHQRNHGKEFIRGNYNGHRMRSEVSPQFLLKRQERMKSRDMSRRMEAAKKARKSKGKA